VIGVFPLKSDKKYSRIAPGNILDPLFVYFLIVAF